MDNFVSYTSLVAAFVVGFFALRMVYHLYFHPLAKFPGPKLAAATFLYEFYYDVVKSGMYIWEIERMHERYGKYKESIERSTIYIRSSTSIQNTMAHQLTTNRPNRPHQPPRITHQRLSLLRRDPRRQLTQTL
jgi:hypothetical protein